MEKQRAVRARLRRNKVRSDPLRRKADDVSLRGMILAVRTLHVLQAVQPGLQEAAGRLGHSNLRILEVGECVSPGVRESLLTDGSEFVRRDVRPYGLCGGRGLD